MRSKKLENHKHMQAIFFTVYNFCRVHSTLKTTPAIKAGLTDRKWTLEDLIDLLADANVSSDVYTTTAFQNS